MLRLAIVLCAVLFASNTIAYTWNDLYEDFILNQLRQANASIFPVIDKMINNSSISVQILRKLYEEISNRSDNMNFAVQQLKFRIAKFEISHPDINICNCKDLYNVQAENMESIFDKTFNCSMTKINLYYIQEIYNDIMMSFEPCKMSNLLNSHLSFRCYRDTRKKVTSFFENSDKLELKIINSDVSYIEEILNDCKTVNEFQQMLNQMLTITDSTDQCINDITRDNTVSA